jgi:phosphohistidine phosphatase
MRIYFLRHGIAEDGGIDVPDRSRRLTPEGIEKMRAEAEGMKRLKVKPDLILTSPLLRAQQTAEIVAKTLSLSDRLLEDERLAYGFDLGALKQIAADHPGVERLMVVGHNPGFSVVPGQLVGGAGIELKKGGLICLQTDRIEPGRAVLEWLLPPAALMMGAE